MAEMQFYDDLKVRLEEVNSNDNNVRTNAETEVETMRDTNPVSTQNRSYFAG